MRESQVEAHLIAVVKVLGGVVRKAQWIGRRGCPDRLVLLPARWARPPSQVWVELKRPGKDAEEHQQREHDLMRAYGCTVITLDTVSKIDDYFSSLYTR